MLGHIRRKIPVTSHSQVNRRQQNEALLRLYGPLGGVKTRGLLGGGCFGSDSGLEILRGDITYVSDKWGTHWWDNFEIESVHVVDDGAGDENSVVDRERDRVIAKGGDYACFV